MSHTSLSLQPTTTTHCWSATSHTLSQWRALCHTSHSHYNPPPPLTTSLLRLTPCLSGALCVTHLTLTTTHHHHSLLVCYVSHLVSVVRCVTHLTLTTTHHHHSLLVCYISHLVSVVRCVTHLTLTTTHHHHSLLVCYVSHHEPGSRSPCALLKLDFLTSAYNKCMR